MIGWTNMADGGVNIQNGKAVIHVMAPVGSTISFSKSGVVVFLKPNKSFVDIVDDTIAHWYYSISSSNYGEWTMTATLGTDTASDTMVIDSNKEYQVVLEYRYYLFQYSAADFEAIKSNFAIMDDAARSVISDGGDHIVFTASGSAKRAWVWQTPIVAAQYSTLVLDGYVSVSSTSLHNMRLREHGDTTNWGTEYYVTSDITNTLRATIQMDISTVMQNCYFQLMLNPSAAFHVWSVYVK